jgi:delta(3,5)-delta(2,4)-dienoyl-CoA isomerase
MWLELRNVFRHLNDASDVRAIVLSGAGPRGFTAGLDTAAAASSGPLSGSGSKLDPARQALGIRKHIYDFQDCISSVEACEKPVICVLHGYAYGLGVDLSCCADVRFASSDTKFCVKEVDIGIAADIGTLTRLPKVVGRESWVKDVCYSARAWGAQEALEVGYVSKVCEGKEETLKQALQWAQLVAGKSPVAVQSTKEVINYSRDHTVADGLKYVAVWNGAALQTTDVQESMKSGMQKRKPTFEKL